MEETVLRKWRDLIALCKSYYVDSVPTGISDSEYDELERRAVVEDNFYVRDYIFCKYLKGAKTKNNYIERIKKEKVADDKTMLETLSELESATNNQLLGLSIAMTLIPIVLLVSSLIIIKKKYIIDEDLYDLMIKEINERK
jgi:hypothetical protein